MKNILYVLIIARGIVEMSEGTDMISRNILQKNVRYCASTIDINTYDQKAMMVAYEYIGEHVKNQKITKKKIVDAVNEAGRRTFWRKKGSEGNYAVYSLTVAKELLGVIAGENVDSIDLLKVVINGIITGRAEIKESQSYCDFAKLGISTQLLSQLNIWK